MRKVAAPRPPTVEILATGDELVRGRSRDTNSPLLAAAATEAGCRVTGFRVVGDDLPALVDAFRAAARRADHVVVTGGLGPTEDDLTRAAAARLLRAPLRTHGPSLRRLREIWSRRGRPMPESNRVQALVPAGAQVLPNPNGSAPGLRFEAAGATFHCLPGVPREMVPMFEASVLPVLRRAARGVATATARLTVFGPAESEFGERVADLMVRSGDVAVGTSVQDGIIRVAVHGQGAAAARVAAVRDAILERMGADVLSPTGADTAEVALESLLLAGATVATAESCTGGLVADRLTAVPGASRAFLGGVVAYANAAKTALLGVDAALLRAHGAVSGPVAEAMARGARTRFGAGFAVAVTGVAGPGGGTPAKPVGLVWFALAGPGGVRSVERRFAGSREFIRSIAAHTALDLVRRAAAEKVDPTSSRAAT